MARTARCTSCGAPVEFRSIASILAVCEFCKSTLVVDGKELKNLGKMAELIEDRSPLQRGAEGAWHGLHFALVGRIQYRYDAGMWNEWHILFDNARSGWLSEAGGEYVLSLPRRVPEALPRFEALRVGDVQALDGTDFRVTNILSAECIAGEGELPFTVGGGYTAPVVDLRSAAGGFATLDYSDDPARPLVFIGESVAFKSLNWANLREKIPIAQINVKARTFNCPSCAAPLEVKHEAILSVGCGSCGAVLDTAHETVKQIAQATERVVEVPWLPLGSQGQLAGEAVEVIGYMARRGDSDGEAFRWHEWVLLGPDGKLLWLTHYDGHWNLGRVLARTLHEVNMKVRLENQDFKHFSTYSATVECVIGEFPWQVRINETAMAEDYIAPPRMLSHEVTDREETWTLQDYIDPAQVTTAFGLKQELPQPAGIYANQVNPHLTSHAAVWGRFWKFLLAATAIQLVLLLFSSNRQLVNDTMTFDDVDDEPRLTREFRLDQRVARLDVEHETDIRNNWLALGLTLVNKDTGEAWQATREISQYEGFEDGESWSEGSRSDAVTFTNLPAGNYVLAEEGELGGSAPRTDNLGGADIVSFETPGAPIARTPVTPVHARVKITRAAPRWSSYFVALVWLGLFPLYTRIRRYGFESKRWADSDHPHVYGSSGGDGGDSGDSGDGGGGDGGGGGD